MLNIQNNKKRNVLSKNLIKKKYIVKLGKTFIDIRNNSRIFYNAD